MFKYRAADIPQMLHVVITGIMTEDEQRHYMADLEPRVRSLKARYGYVLILVDVSAADNETQARIGTARARNGPLISADRDRLAVVMASNLLKATYKQHAPASVSKAFVSAGAALTWLLANEALPLSHRAA